MRITTNVASLNAQRVSAGTQRQINKSFAQLASGSRITKAADDAAGLSISEKMKSTIRSYGQAQRNAQDGISLVQVAEGGINEISNMLVRLRELAVQAATDTVGDRERGFLDKETQQLKLEIQRISETTRFGDTRLLDGSGEAFEFQVDINNDDFQDRISFDAGKTNVQLSNLNLEDLDYSTKGGAREALEYIEDAQTEVNDHRSTLGAIQNRLVSTMDNLGVAVENFSAANSRIRDTDVAKSTAGLAAQQVLQQASTGIMAQTNQSTAYALKLIG